MLNRYTLAVMILAVTGGLFAADFTLRDQVKICGEVVRMADVLAMDPQSNSTLGALIIAPAPDLGQSMTMSRQELKDKLVGNGVYQPVIQGAATVHIQRSGFSVQTQTLQNLVQAYVTRNSKWKDGVTVEIVSNKEIIVPNPQVQWVITPANGQDFFGNVLFKLSALEGPREILSQWLIAKLRIEQDVLVTNRLVEKNEILTPADFRVEKREINAFTRNALQHDEALGKKTARIIQPNTVITTECLEKEYLVRRGEQATLIADFKGIQATSGVTVLANGIQGETVQVMNSNSKRIITAVVKGKSTLEVKIQ